MTPVDEMAISCKTNCIALLEQHGNVLRGDRSRKQCVRACGCWADRGRRDCERFNRRAGRTGIMIYLDYSANTPVSEDVLRCFCETEREFLGTRIPRTMPGKAARKRMDEVTVSIAGLMGGCAGGNHLYFLRKRIQQYGIKAESLRWRVREACILFPLRWSILRWAGV